MLSRIVVFLDCMLLKGKKTFLCFFILFTVCSSISSQTTEDFESGSAAGWTTSGSASTGTFIVGNPSLETSGGITTQLEDDHTPGAGVNAYFTATNTSAGNRDVDGGTSIATSPTYAVTSDSQLSIWYFFGQRDAGDDSNDYFLLEYSVNSGISFTTLVSIGDIQINANWTEATVFIPASSNLVVRVTASDGSGTGDIIEAGIDDLEILPIMDTDGDGILDFVDLDDDNDGILDTTECAGLSVPFENGGFELPVITSSYVQINEGSVPGWQTTASDGLIEIWSSGFLGVPSQEGNQFVELNATQVSTLFQTFNLNGMGGTVDWSVYHRGRSGTETANVLFGETLATAIVEETMTDGTGGWGYYSGSFTIPPGQTTLVIAFESVVGGSVGNFLDNIVVSINEACIDTDSDGITDDRDLDSDNDNCDDVLEAGFTDDNGDGRLGPNPVTVDSNGQVTSGTNGYTTPLDGNSNGTFDFQETGNVPNITLQPVDVTICPGCTTFLSATSNGTIYQWQRFNGVIWEDLTDSGIYSGSTTNTLTIANATVNENNGQYRVNISNLGYICNVISDMAILTIQVNTVITNRRITYRVNKN